MHDIAQLKELFPPAGKRLQFWWPLCICAAVLGLLWAQVPFGLMLDRHPMGTPSVPPSPSAAYVVLDETFAAQAFRRIRSSWSSDDQKTRTAFDIEFSETGNALPEPWELPRSSDYPVEWHPAPIPPLQTQSSGILLPSADSTISLPPIKETLHITLSPGLESAGFSFDLPKNGDFASPSGSARFEIETGADGRVEHLLSLSAPSADLRRLESAIFCGHATGAASGFISCEWHFTSTKNKANKVGD